MWEMLLGLLKGGLKGTISGVLNDLGESAFDEKLTDAIPAIVTKMESDGVTFATHTPRQVVRSAIFRLWKVIVKNGHVADAFRDAQDDKVVAAVLLAITESTPLPELVTKTKVEIVRLTF